MTNEDEIISKSRQRRLVSLAKKEGCPVLMDVIADSRHVLTEHVADIIEGAEMRLRSRAILSRATGHMSPDAARMLFGPPLVRQTTTIEVGAEVVDAEIVEDADRS